MGRYCELVRQRATALHLPVGFRALELPHRLAGYLRFGRFGIPIAFAVVTAPVFLIVAVLLVRAEQEGATEALVRATEVQNAGIARTLANAHADPISYLLALDIGGAPELLPIMLDRSGLEPLIAASLRDTNVINVRLYDGDGVTLFSLDRDQIGENVADCACLTRTMSDGSFSEIVHYGHNHNYLTTGAHAHASGELDVLSTMIRLSVLAPDLVASDGILEVQSDVTGLLAAIVATRHETSLVLGIPLALLYIFMTVIVAIGHATIMRRDRQAAAFAARAAESEASDRAKSEFLSLMSHELRTPLNAIVGFAQLIGDRSRGKPDEETAGWADAIHDSGLHMTRVVSSILDMTALELGELQLNREVLHMREVVRTALQAVQPAFDNALVTLNLHDDPGQAPVMGDREKLSQVFENLLSNAARFTPAGGSVDVTFGQAVDGFVSVSVRDTGAGMTKQQIAQARLPFQADWTGYSRDVDGAGLGLTISDKIVNSLGGELSIESTPGEGSTMTVRLPCLRPDDSNITAFRQPSGNRTPAGENAGMDEPRKRDGAHAVIR